MALKAGVDLTLTETNALNPKSFWNHLENGGIIVSAGRHHHHGESILIATPLRRDWNKASKINGRHDQFNREDVAGMLQATKTGMFGIGYNQEGQTFSFASMLNSQLEIRRNESPNIPLHIVLG
jgi:Tfp pilus assembly protein PilZ